MKRWPEPPGRFGAPRAEAIGSRRHPRERRPLPRGARASARMSRTRRDRRGRPRPAKWIAKDTPRCFGSGKRPRLPPGTRPDASAAGNGPGGPPGTRPDASAAGNGPGGPSRTRPDASAAGNGQDGPSRTRPDASAPGNGPDGPFRSPDRTVAAPGGASGLRPERPAGSGYRGRRDRYGSPDRPRPLASARGSGLTEGLYRPRERSPADLPGTRASARGKERRAGGRGGAVARSEDREAA
jgi:hypothetical protein